MNNDPIGYVEEMAYAYGETGRQLGEEIIAGNRRGIWETDKVIDFPLNERLVETARAVTVHSQFVRSGLSARWPSKIHRAGICVGSPSVRSEPVSPRSALDVPEDTFLLGSFGFLTANRSIPAVLRVVSELRRNVPVHLLLVGELQDPAVLPTIKELGLDDHVSVVGYASDADYESYLQSCDCCVNLRYPSMGETSASLIEALNAGKPCIVSDVGWYAELPDEVVVKTSPQADIRRLARQIGELATDRGKAQRLGEHGRQYAARQYSVARVTARYTEIMQELAAS